MTAAVDQAGPADAWELVAAAQGGDQEALGPLYRHYREVVFRYVMVRMCDHNLAEDITQETFVRALRAIGSVSYQGRDIGAWFVTIARNLIFDHVKSSRYRLDTSVSEVEVPAEVAGPEQKALDRETATELRRYITALSPDQQECIRYRFLQELSVTETAELMGRGESAVKAIQSRGVRELSRRARKLRGAS